MYRHSCGKSVVSCDYHSSPKIKLLPLPIPVPIQILQILHLITTTTTKNNLYLSPFIRKGENSYQMYGCWPVGKRIRRLRPVQLAAKPVSWRQGVTLPQSITTHHLHALTTLKMEQKGTKGQFRQQSPYIMSNQESLKTLDQCEKVKRCPQEKL